MNIQLKDYEHFHPDPIILGMTPLRQIEMTVDVVTGECRYIVKRNNPDPHCESIGHWYTSLQDAIDDFNADD